MARCRLYAKYGTQITCLDLAVDGRQCMRKADCAHQCTTREWMQIREERRAEQVLESQFSTFDGLLMDHEKDNADQNDTFLVSFKSGHYKKIRGTWKGDSVWAHFIKVDGGMIHINKDEVEYIEALPDSDG